MDIISCGFSLVNSLKNLWPRKPKLRVRLRDGVSTRHSASFCSFFLTFTLSNNGTKNCSLIEWKVVFDNITYEPCNLRFRAAASPQTIDIPDGTARELKVDGSVHIQDVEVNELKGRIILEFSHGKKNTCEFCIKMKDIRDIRKKIFKKIQRSGFLDDLPPINLP
ncbi:MAG: hypothetical protein NTX52_11095 [Planctomycetota bacterium]|nr:hypothetical protein [Planctomycetota bacterium]